MSAVFMLKKGETNDKDLWNDLRNRNQKAVDITVTL